MEGRRMNLQLTQLIWNEALIKEFVEMVIPTLTADHVLVLFGGIRRKYYPKLKKSEIICCRKIIKKSEPHYFLKKVKELAASLLLTYDNETFQAYPPSSMAIYINVNRKSMLKAAIKIINVINDQLYQAIVNKDADQLRKFKKIDSQFFSSIHKSNLSAEQLKNSHFDDRREYTIVDIDEKSETLLEMVIEKLSNHIVWVTETHGGYHLIVNKTKESGRLIYTEVKPLHEKIEILKETSTPLPGTYQGGFPVKKILLNKGD